MNPWHSEISDKTEEKIMKYIENASDKKILDYGAGSGRYLDMFSKYFKKENIYAAEVEEFGLSVINSKGYNCYKPSLNDPELPFEDGCFDYIFTSNVVEHIDNENYKRIIKEFYRVLNPDGVLLIGAPSYPFKRIFDFKKALKTKNYKYYFFDDPTHINKLSILQYERDLKEVFGEVKLYPTEIIFQRYFLKLGFDTYNLRFLTDKFFGHCKK